MSVELSRRQLFRYALPAVVGAVNVLNPGLTQITQAAAIVFSSEDRQTKPAMILSTRQAWSTWRWWPVDEQIAINANPQQPKLQDDYWPAYVFDQEYQQVGGESDVQDQSKKKATNILIAQPDQRPSAGYCTWVAAAQSSEDEPAVKEGEVLGGATAPEMIRALKEGLLAIKYAGTPLVQLDPEKLKEALLASFQNGYRIITNIPSRPGIWFRSVNGLSEDGEFVRVTNFGYPDTDFPISSIVSAYLVYSNTDIGKLPFNQNILDSTGFWRYHNIGSKRNELDRGFIDWLVAGKP